MLGLKYKTMIDADDKNISYMGRIDFSNKKSPIIYFAGSSITIRFKGTAIGAVIVNHRFYNIMELGAVVDGKESKIRFSEDDKEICLEIAENLDDTEHEVVLFKRQDATHYFEFKGFAIDGEILPAKPKPTRKIECYGDSVSAGAVCEALDYVAQLDPDDTQGVFDNSWHSYSMITARNLGAQIHNIAQGGIAIFDGTGYYHYPDHVGMESAYDKLCYIPEAGIKSWDFSLYTPSVVIFAIGQNDNHHEGHEDFDINDTEYRSKWKNAYKNIISDLRSKYPKATFVLILTVLMHDSGWDSAVCEIAEEMNDEKIYYLKFKRAGKATPGHPRIPEQCEMAEELTAFISGLGDSVWE
ncbi:MAG: GDSL-type esterase/lipase family protein [Ruminococcus sp.]|nr:GDSL-type esterase/lipase family protein [Ruminococcus sp.]